MAGPKIEKLLTPYNFTDANNTERIKYIVLHYVGALGGAEANCKYYAGKYIGASAHYFVGFDGEIWQSVEDGDIAWHCGAKNYLHPECRNSNSIGIELCVRCKGNQSPNGQDWYFEDATVNAAEELVRYLMQKYGVDAEHVVRHYDVTGKICPNPYVYNHTAHKWEEFKEKISESADSDEKDKKNAMTKITGKAEATAMQMEAYIRSKNKNVSQSVIDMIPLYLSEGEAENIRGDVTFAQSCLETGNFTYRGSAVKPEHNNFSGLGVTENGKPGNIFGSPLIGIRAQTQHMKAYANTAKLKQECVDPRFEYVSRGSAPYVEWLGQKENPKGKGWAAGAGYGEKILRILDEILHPVAEMIVETTAETTKEQKTDAVYLITTTCDSLNIRAGAGMGNPVIGKIQEPEGRKKKYTIVEEKRGWGKLKSGAGWIFLKYTQKVS